MEWKHLQHRNHAKVVDNLILLFEGNETDFASNGLGALQEATYCQVTQERNGVFEAEIQYPVTGLHYKDLANRKLVFVKPDPYSDAQPFRIYQITKPISGIVTLYARHIAYDLMGVPISPFSVGGVQSALQGLQSNAALPNPFTFWTDKSSSATFTVESPTACWSLLGGNTGSILDVFGGEYEFDRFTVKLWNQRGSNNGVTIRYGKNLTDLKQEENISNVATGIYPYWKAGDGTLVELPEKIVNAPGNYDFQRVVPVDFTGDFDSQPTESQLREKAEAYVTDNNIGVPTVSISVSFQPLEQTEEYKNLALLERVNLCDTVTVEYPALGVSAKAKCVKTVYDALADRYVSIELGDAKSNMADIIADQSKEITNLPNSTAFQEAVSAATSLITGNRGGYVVLHDTTGNGQPDEILIMDTPDISTAQKVWRWNNGGLGYSGTGYNGPYGTAITQDGEIVAGFITTGQLNANIIKSGRIESLKPGGPYFDLEANGGKGELAASILRGVEDGTTTTAVIGQGTYSGGEEYEGLSVHTTSGAGGGLAIAIARETGSYTLSNAVDVFSYGDLSIRSQAIATNPGGSNRIIMSGNSTSGQGIIYMERGKSGGSDGVFQATSQGTSMSFEGNSVFISDKIEFATGGYARASIEDRGAYFGDLYTNGIKVTSDRAKKEQITALKGSALEMVQQAKAYRYTLKDTGERHTGLMYDEAPECIRSQGEEKSVDLYAMASVLWKAIQELNAKVEQIAAKMEGSHDL